MREFRLVEMMMMELLERWELSAWKGFLLKSHYDDGSDGSGGDEGEAVGSYSVLEKVMEMMRI